MDDVKDATLKGKKVKQKDTGLMESFYLFFSVVYDEQIFKFKVEKIRKVYPIIVKLW